MSEPSELFPTLPSWLARMPANMDALGIAASIERCLPRSGWRGAINDAKAAGFAVDVDYLRDRWRIIESHEARKTGRAVPETSRMAMESVTTSGKRAAHVGLIVVAVVAEPGRTSAELAESLHLDRVETARRTSDAMNDGLIVQGVKRKCAVCHARCVTWWPVRKEIRNVV